MLLLVMLLEIGGTRVQRDYSNCDCTSGQWSLRGGLLASIERAVRLGASLTTGCTTATTTTTTTLKNVYAFE